MPAHPEGMVAKENRRAILAVLDHQRPWPFVEDPAGSAQQVVLAGKLPRLAIVDDHHIHAADGLRKLLRRGFDPKRMRIQSHQPRRFAHFFVNLGLQPGMDVAQKDVLRIQVAGRNLWLEFF